MEVWKTIKDYPNYQVSNLGRVKSLSRINERGSMIKEKIMKQCFNGGGYLQVPLRNNNIRKNVLVHRLVMINFVTNKENKPDVNHKNGIKYDNALSNLEWCTTKENVIHAYKNEFCTDKKGTLNGRNLLSESQVLEIRSLKEIKICKLAIKYNVSWSCINSILKRKTWKHI